MIEKVCTNETLEGKKMRVNKECHRIDFSLKAKHAHSGA